MNKKLNKYKIGNLLLGINLKNVLPLIKN